MSAEESQKIDQFIGGTLPPEEAIAFANRLAADASLRQRVELRRSLMQYYGSDEPAFRTVLAEVDAAYYAPGSEVKPGSRRLLWWFLFVGLLLSALLAWFYFGKNLTSQQSLPDGGQQRETNSQPLSPIGTDTLGTRPSVAPQVPDSSSTSPVTDPASRTPAGLSPASAPKVPKEKKTNGQPGATEKQGSAPPASPVFAEQSAVRFRPNPPLEEIISEISRNTELEITLNVPSLSDTLFLALGSVVTVKTVAKTLPALEVLIYDNSPDRFIGDLPVLRQTINEQTAEQAGQETPINLSRLPHSGSYYILIVGKDGEILKGRKILVSKSSLPH